MELNPQEWIFIIAGLITAVAIYVRRDKVRNLFGGGKPGDKKNRF